MFEPLEFCCSLDTLSILFSFQFILSKTTDISKSVFWDSISVVAPTQMQHLRHGIVFFFFLFFRFYEIIFFWYYFLEKSYNVLNIGKDMSEKVLNSDQGRPLLSAQVLRYKIMFFFDKSFGGNR